MPLKLSGIFYVNYINELLNLSECRIGIFSGL